MRFASATLIVAPGFGAAVATPVGVRRLGPVLLLALVALLAAAPSVFGFSTGICNGCEGGANAPPPAGEADFGKIGCVACHGPGSAAPHEFAAGGTDVIQWSFTDAEGNTLAGNAYDPHAVYTLTITLDEQNEPGAANHAGFNLRASAGKLEAVAGQSQVSGDGSQATHVGPGLTSWEVTWTPPASGAVGFDLFVNDVDGSSSPNEGDQVYRTGIWITDEEGAMVGSAPEEEVEFGISLQQYWIGLIGLAGMIFVMVAGFVYLKFVNPHNTDPKDR
ncbi:MAG TPA: choice-of-anchor V domain-containing protein [Candidatus Thermoplasmatota archaeon]|nr:choice-of-anchor V domain-containing protein [Candidatus Thermoplasmatota archaeon]